MMQKSTISQTNNVKSISLFRANSSTALRAGSKTRFLNSLNKGYTNLLRVDLYSFCVTNFSTIKSSNPILFLKVQTFGKQEKCLKVCLKDYLKQQLHYYTLTKVGNTK